VAKRGNRQHPASQLADFVSGNARGTADCAKLRGNKSELSRSRK
jgi:hypothetical protein